ATLAGSSGVGPVRSAALTSAPASSSRRTASVSFRYAAQCSAVAPSACASFTSAPCSSRRSSAAVSPRITASATSAAKAGAQASDAAAAAAVHARLPAKRVCMLIVPHIASTPWARDPPASGYERIGRSGSASSFPDRRKACPVPAEQAAWFQAAWFYDRRGDVYIAEGA